MNTRTHRNIGIHYYVISLQEYCFKANGHAAIKIKIINMEQNEKHKNAYCLDRRNFLRALNDENTFFNDSRYRRPVSDDNDDNVYST